MTTKKMAGKMSSPAASRWPPPTDLASGTAHADTSNPLPHLPGKPISTVVISLPKGPGKPIDPKGYFYGVLQKALTAAENDAIGYHVPVNGPGPGGADSTAIRQPVTQAG